MPSAESIRSGLRSWVDSMALPELQALHRLRCQFDPNFKRHPAPAGWISLKSIAAEIRRDRDHLTRRCPAWAAAGLAAKHTSANQVAWFLAPSLVAELRAAARSTCAEREAKSRALPHGARLEGRSPEIPPIATSARQLPLESPVQSSGPVQSPACATAVFEALSNVARLPVEPRS